MPEDGGRFPRLKDLYIYYVDGRAGTGEEIAGPHFMGNWEEEDVSFLFFSAPSRALVDDFIEARPDLSLIDEYRMPYEQWHGEAPSRFRAGSLWFVPARFQDFRPQEPSAGHGPFPPVSSEPVLPDPILMDPGVVFGAGNHATTRDCVAALEFVFRRGPVKTVLDMGTGSGILSLAARRLGRVRVLALDLNFLAAATARDNIRLNHMEDRVLAVKGNALDFTDFPFDLVVANIHHDVMKDMMTPEFFSNKSYVILSGLLKSQGRDIVQRLEGLPAKVEKRWSRDGVWHTFLTSPKKTD
ncbi:conserved hypothetical protein [Candidatus Desulfarcum epimagneticum]|uniref:Ribosomal protein L11 methyltransferase n=1 Tax=uncultured Desulfobacteraceae bacterium TaxID=218296 RepID=A0A484HG57_9BACT|nr:conserved hypothetical protein [uncultured Desulfobacteraceae bacterium]